MDKSIRVNVKCKRWLTKPPSHNLCFIIQILFHILNLFRCHFICNDIAVIGIRTFSDECRKNFQFILCKIVLHRASRVDSFHAIKNRIYLRLFCFNFCLFIRNLRDIIANSCENFRIVIAALNSHAHQIILLCLLSFKRF